MLIRQNASAPPGVDMTSAEVAPGVSVGVSRLSKKNNCDFEKVHSLYKKNKTPLHSQILQIAFTF